MKIFRQKIAPVVLLALLSASGGCMDAYSYLYCEGVFAYAQTGNILLFCINLVRGEFSNALVYMGLIAAFICGTAGAFLLERLHKGWTPFLHKWRTLILEIVILVAAAFAADYNHLIATAMISFACGLQLESFASFMGVYVGTAMCIGNLRSAVHHGMECVVGNGKQNRLPAMLFSVALLAFICGAALGNFVVALFGTYAVLASCVLLGISIVFAFLVYDND